MQILLWISGGLLMLVFVLTLALQVPLVQQFAADKVTAYLAQKLDTKVAIGRFTTDWKNSFVLKDFYLEDQHQDTLIYARRLGVNLNILALRQQKYIIKSVRISDGVLHIRSRTDNGPYNFSFIGAAFNHSDKQKVNGERTQLKIGLIDLTNTHVLINDSVRGTFANASIGKLILNTDIFDNQISTYQLGDIKVKNSVIQYTKTKLPANSGEEPTAAIGFDKIAIENLVFNYRNSVTATKVRLKIGTSELTAKEIDIRKKLLDLKQFNLENSTVSLLQDKSKTLSNSHIEKRKLAALGWKVNLKKMAFENLDLNYRNTVTATRLGLKIGTSELTAKGIDLKKKQLDLKQFTLENSTIALHQDKHKTQTKSDNRNSKSAALGWQVNLNKMGLKKVNFNRDNQNFPRKKQGLDVNYLKLTALNLSLEDLLYTRKQFTTELKNLAFKERSGLQVKHAHGIIQADSGHLAIRKFVVKTENSRLGNDLELTFNQPPNNRIKNFKADLKDATIGLSDLRFIAPDLANLPAYKQNQQRTVKINGQISGNGKDLNFKNLWVTALTSTKLKLNGHVRNFSEQATRNFVVQVQEFTTSPSDLKMIMPAGSLPQKLKLPSRLSFNGNLSGNSQQYNLNGFNFRASGGTTLAASGTIRQNKGKNKQFDLTIGKLHTSGNALKEMLPPGAVSPEIHFPELINFSGNVKGTSAQNLAASGKFETSFGDIETQINMQPAKHYTGSISMKDFNIGKVLKQEKKLGKATGHADFKGSGFKANTMVLSFDAFIKKIMYQKEYFRNVEVDGTLNKTVYAIDGNLSTVIMQGLGHKLKKLKPKNLKNVSPKRLVPKRFKKKKSD